MIHAKPPNDSTVKQSPWLVGEQRYLRINDHDQIIRILKGIRDNNLFVTIAAPDGPNTLFYDSFLLDIKKDRIRLYRTTRWPENNSKEFFRVFSRNNEGCWYSLKAVLDQQDSHSISIAMPKTLYVLRHRDHDRLEPPPETMVTFTGANSPDTVFQVVNISIDLPAGGKLPTIKQAQVVRRYRTDKDNLLCYGILFKKDCQAGEKIIWTLIAQDGIC